MIPIIVYCAALAANIFLMFISPPHLEHLWEIFKTLSAVAQSQLTSGHMASSLQALTASSKDPLFAGSQFLAQVGTKTELPSPTISQFPVLLEQGPPLFSTLLSSISSGPKPRHTGIFTPLSLLIVFIAASVAVLALYRKWYPLYSHISRTQASQRAGTSPEPFFCFTQSACDSSSESFMLATFISAPLGMGSAEYPSFEDAKPIPVAHVDDGFAELNTPLVCFGVLPPPNPIRTPGGSPLHGSNVLEYMPKTSTLVPSDLHQMHAGSLHGASVKTCSPTDYNFVDESSSSVFLRNTPVKSRLCSSTPARRIKERTNRQTPKLRYSLPAPPSARRFSASQSLKNSRVSSASIHEITTPTPSPRGSSRLRTSNKLGLEIMSSSHFKDLGPGPRSGKSIYARNPSVSFSFHPKPPTPPNFNLPDITFLPKTLGLDAIARAVMDDREQSLYVPRDPYRNSSPIATPDRNSNPIAYPDEETSPAYIEASMEDKLCYRESPPERVDEGVGTSHSRPRREGMVTEDGNLRKENGRKALIARSSSSEHLQAALYEKAPTVDHFSPSGIGARGLLTDSTPIQTYCRAISDRSLEQLGSTPGSLSRSGCLEESFLQSEHQCPVTLLALSFTPPRAPSLSRPTPQQLVKPHNVHDPHRAVTSPIPEIVPLRGRSSEAWFPYGEPGPCVTQRTSIPPVLESISAPSVLAAEPEVDLHDPPTVVTPPGSNIILLRTPSPEVLCSHDECRSHAAESTGTLPIPRIPSTEMMYPHGEPQPHFTESTMTAPTPEIIAPRTPLLLRLEFDEVHNRDMVMTHCILKTTPIKSRSPEASHFLYDYLPSNAECSAMPSHSTPGTPRPPSPEALFRSVPCTATSPHSPPISPQTPSRPLSLHATPLAISAPDSTSPEPGELLQTTPNLSLCQETSMIIDDPSSSPSHNSPETLPVIEGEAQVVHEAKEPHDECSPHLEEEEAWVFDDLRESTWLEDELRAAMSTPLMRL